MDNTKLAFPKPLRDEYNGGEYGMTLREYAAAAAIAEAVRRIANG